VRSLISDFEFLTAMTRIDLPYGRALLPFEFKEEQFQVLVRSDTELPPLSDPEIGAALDAPIGSTPLDEIVATGDSVLIVVSDATRATASAQIVNLLVRRLIQYGISPADTAVIFATGIHRQVTASEKSDLLTPFIAQRVRTLDHRYDEADQLVSLGQTPNGTPIEINRALKEFSHVILTGGIGFHYFAGFTGGRKSVCPGLASANTIRGTHMLALDFENGTRRQGVGTGLLDGNAVHEECDFIANEVNPSFSINSVVDKQGRAVRLYAGHWREAHRRACDDYLRHHSMPIAAPRELVIASCGGFPFDINLIQAHKTLDMAARACSEGGAIILMAQCSEGFGRADFMKWFGGDSRSLAERLKTDYEVNGQTAWALLSKTEKYEIHLVSELNDDDVRRMGMISSRSLAEALSKISSTTSGYILPRGATFLPVVEPF
jgi:lactate racemase